MAINLIQKLIIKKTIKKPEIFIDKYNFKICTNFPNFLLWSNWFEFVGGENGTNNNS